MSEFKKTKVVPDADGWKYGEWEYRGITIHRDDYVSKGYWGRWTSDVATSDTLGGVMAQIDNYFKTGNKHGG